MAQAIATYKPLAEKRKHELEGGIVIIGRPTFKEFMAGLKQGWTDGLEEVDQDELLARELESDGHFDEPEEADNSEISAPQKIPGLSGPLYSPLFAQPPHPPSPERRLPFSESLNTAPTTIPPTPPLLLVTFTNYIGFTQIPRMVWDFFNQRHKVHSGAEAGYRLVMKHNRPIIPPSGEPELPFSDITPQTNENGDLDFDKHVESFYKKSLSSIPADIEKAREKYYEALPAKLATARALARGTREPTKDEKEYPPPTEVELSAERMKNEQRWRRDLEGWDIVKPTQKVVWDDRFRDSLRIFINPSSARDNLDIDID
jgi:import inner membrane translocase subunit TIM54